MPAGEVGVGNLGQAKFGHAIFLLANSPFSEVIALPASVTQTSQPLSKWAGGVSTALDQAPMALNQ
jgi:hypothetical protein